MIGALTEPIEHVTLVSLVVWYIVPTVIAVGISVTAEQFSVEFTNPFKDEPLAVSLISGVIVAPLVEEWLFRILPSMHGASVETLYGLSVLWALLHRDRVVLVIWYVPLFVKMALGGLYLELILLHALHNGIGIVLDHYI
jgi:membrane protease YdiL (CAAX protease family)